MVMAFSNIFQKQPLIPHFLYSSSSTTSASRLPRSHQHNFMIPAPNEPLRKMEMYSPRFYATCAVGGMLSCGLTHLAYTPLHLVKSKMLMDPIKYVLEVLLKEQGMRGFFKGWSPTLVGYGAQGACRFGFYEFFKKYYSDIADPEYPNKYAPLIYMAASASAEVIASIALCPMEAVKFNVQTQPGFARGLIDGLPKFVKSQGALGLYKGLVPLWRRQIPYTMINFHSYEIYKCDYGSLYSGYAAGMLSAFILNSHALLSSFSEDWKATNAAMKYGYLDIQKLRLLPLFQRIFMIGILSGIQWGIYDSFKMFYGL